MWYIIEKVIIILAGLGSVVFLAGYFFISSIPKKHCGCSGVGCGVYKKEIFSKILRNNKNKQVKKAGEKCPAATL
jgi:hypothetical protein